MREKTDLELQMQPLNMEYSLKNDSDLGNTDSMTSKSVNTLSSTRRYTVWTTGLLLRIVITYIFAIVISASLLVPLAIVYLRHNTFFDYPFFAVSILTTTSIIGLIISMFSFRQLITGTSKYTPFHLYFSFFPVLLLMLSLVFYGIYKAGHDPFRLKEIFQLQLLATDRFKEMINSPMLKIALTFSGIEKLDFETINHLVLKPEVLELADNVWIAAQTIFVFSTVISLIVFTWSMVETFKIGRMESRDLVQSDITVVTSERNIETTVV